MIIDTDEWISLAQAMDKLDMSDRAARRLAADLGIIHVFFGVQCIRIKDIKTLNASRRQRGNQDWIASSELASKASEKAVKSRMDRVARDGLTAKERRRNEFLSSGGASRGEKLRDS